jgi:hypothetical protein
VDATGLDPGAHAAGLVERLERRCIELVLSAGPLVRLSTGHAHATGMAATKPPSTRTAIRVPCNTIPYTIFLVHEYHSIVVM